MQISNLAFSFFKKKMFGLNRSEYGNEIHFLNNFLMVLLPIQFIIK